MPEPITDAEARRQLREVEAAIEAAVEDRDHAEASVADADHALIALRRRQRDLTILLAPERAGVPRVVRKG